MHSYKKRKQKQSEINKNRWKPGSVAIVLFSLLCKINNIIDFIESIIKIPEIISTILDLIESIMR
jgi:hypothetical protein